MTGGEPRYSRASRQNRLQPSRLSPAFATLTLLRRALLDILTHRELGQLGRIVDMGCAERDYESLFTPVCTEYLGCDLEGNQRADLEFARDGSVPLPDGSADTVLSIQVLEHVAHPGAYLREAHRLLAPGGRILLSTHGVWRHHPDPRDLWRWTGEGLCEELARAGFEVFRLRGIVGPVGTAIQLWQNATAGRLPRPLRQVYTFLLQSLILLFEGQRARTRDCAVFLVIGRRVDESAGSLR